MIEHQHQSLVFVDAQTKVNVTHILFQMNVNVKRADSVNDWYSALAHVMHVCINEVLWVVCVNTAANRRVTSLTYVWLNV